MLEQAEPFIIYVVCWADLSIKKCVPCIAKDLQPMTEEVANGLIPRVRPYDVPCQST